MPRKPTTATVTIGFEFGLFFPLKTVRRVSAYTRPEGKPQAVSLAKDNDANFALVQHFIHYLAPQGIAGFVLANGSKSCRRCSLN
jgi:hypothetical protein